MERPDWSALRGMVGDIRRTIDNIDGVQKQMLKITGVAWSDDSLIKAVVGPRGQLIELEIDPRVYRKPNSSALAAAIVATVRLAVADAARKSREIIEQNVPSDLRVSQVGGVDFTKLMNSHDADLVEGGARDE